MTVSLYSISQANEKNIYSWRADNGNMVFSENKPVGNTDYKTIAVRKPTVVKTQVPESNDADKKVKIDHSDIKKLADSKLAEENEQVLKEAQGSVCKVKITSPSESDNKFSKEQKIPIITKPAISSNDKPIFMVNDKSVAAKYEDGQWLIPRPSPGENKISIAGTTADGKKLQSSNTATLRIFNGTVLQMKNTGNYRRAR